MTTRTRRRSTGRTRGALIGLTVLALNAAPAAATWVEDGSVVIQRIWNQESSLAVPDGEGGVFVVFHDSRASASIGSEIYDIYAQRLDGDGNQLWGTAGAVVCAATGTQAEPTAVPDGFGGLLVAWHDQRTDPLIDIYAQRLDANGVPQWSVDGVPVVTRTGTELDPSLVADGTGGVYIAWSEYAFESPAGDIYAQRLSAAGGAQWAVDGIPVSNVLGRNEVGAKAISDGNGGVIIGWSDDRFGDRDVFGQRLATDGTKLWFTGGNNFTNVAGTNEFLSSLVADGFGGGYVVWLDFRSGSSDLYAMQFNSAGNWQWNDGRAVVVAPNIQNDAVAILAENGDLIVGWYDQRDSADPDLYAQRLAASDGAGLWAYQGAPVANYPETQYSLRVTTDDADGAFFTWRDNSGVDDVIRAQRLNPYGAQMWDPLGMPLCEAPNNSPLNRSLVSDGRGGAIAVWDDDRSGNRDVRAQRVEPREGFWGRPEPQITKVVDIPGDQGGQVRVSWRGSGRDAVPFTMITHYSVWRATSAAAVAAQKAAGTPLRLVELADITPEFTGPAYRNASGDFYWEYIGEQSAIYAPNYSFAAATEADSTAALPALHYFQIAAHTASQFQTFPSQPDSGASVDNLAPGAPALLVAQRTGGADVDLSWGPLSEATPDFGQYQIYRSAGPNVPVDAGHFLAATTDTVLTDMSASPSQAYYYVVVAVDVHANQGPPTNEAMVGDSVSAVGDPLVLNSPRMLAPSPNPFTTTTMFRVGLPASGSATLEVYDVAGRRMSRTHYADLSQGWQQIRFNGRDDSGQALPSGVYFCRLRAGQKAVTQKMIIAR